MKNGRNDSLKDVLERAWEVPPLSKDSRERFLEKLDGAEHPRRHRLGLYIGILSSVAAFVVGFVLILQQPRAADDSAPAKIELTIAEVKGYYKSKLWSESEYIMMLTESMDAGKRESLLQEIKKMELDSDSLVENLQNEPISDDFKIMYITQIYKSHLRSMQHIHGLLLDMVAENQQ